MGFIKEPDGIDFVIQSKPLTKKKEKELSEFIATRKLAIKKKSKKGTYAQHSSKAKANFLTRKIKLQK
jgi:hypothetical protein